MAESPMAPDVPSPSPRRRARIGWWLARVTLVMLGVSGIYLSLFPSGRGTLRAATLLPRVIGLGATADATSIRRHEQTLDFGGTNAIIDLAEPVAAPPLIPGSRGAMIIIAGVGDNRENAQLTNLESSLAQSGVVLSLLTPALTSYILAPSDSNAVVAAFDFLSHRSGVNPKAIGLIGISAGGGLVSLGVADARIRDKVAFIALFGAYFDTTQLLANLGHRALRDAHGNYTQPWHPQKVPLSVLAYSVADLLPPDEGARITASFHNGTPLSPIMLASFSPAGAAIYHLLMGDAPDMVEANIARLTPAMHMRLDALSPKSVVGDINAPIYLLHDRNDEFVPFTETIDFGNWLTAHHREHTEVLFDIFQHVEVQSGLPITTLVGDGARLFGVLTSIMSYGA